jgi:hypothetical protein
MNKKQIANQVINAIEILTEQLELNPRIAYQDNELGRDQLETILCELEGIAYAFEMAAENN